MIRARVAVIGAGWAGLSAAARLADRGFPVTLFEASRHLGGRARGLDWTLADGRVIALDNGQHILLGAYRETLSLMQLCGVIEADVLLRMPVRLEDTDGFVLRAWRLPAPWHLLMAIVTARGLSGRSRFDMVRLILRARAKRWYLAQDQTVSQWLAAENQGPQVIGKVWRPLCVAALNTPIELASAQVFLNVLRDSLGSNRSASDLLLPRAPLDALLPNACAAFLQKHDGTIRLGTRVTNVRADSDGVDISGPEGPSERFDAAILAVPAHQVSGLFDPADMRGAPLLEAQLAQCAELTWQPITTVYLLYAAPVRLAAPMLALIESVGAGHFGQWVFDKSQLGGPNGLIAVVISAQGPHQELDQQTITAAVIDQLRVQLGLSPTVTAARVISEKRATFACIPNLSRPAQDTSAPRLALTGDYTASEHPATLETAVANGHAAALLIERSVGIA